MRQWLMSDGKAQTRMKTELTMDELNKLPLKESSLEMKSWLVEQNECL
jgi:hypothetical protein